MDAQRCLVIGGGFLGSHVSARLAQDGHRVTIFSRSFNEWLLREDRSGAGAIRLVEGEIAPGEALEALVGEADIVFYMAGVSTPAMASLDLGGSIVSHVVPAAIVLDAMGTTATRRIVVASSGGTVYGAVTHVPTSEDDATHPISLHGHHSLTIERYAQYYAEQHSFETIILRYSNPYGPGQIARRGQGVIAAWTYAHARGRPIALYGDPATRRDFVHVEDACVATVAAALDAPPGVYNVGSGQSAELSEVIALIEAASGRPAEVERHESRGVDVPRTQLDCTRLREATGWQPHVSLADGVRDTYSWAQTVPYER